MVKHRPTTIITHREICKAVGKIGAYLRLGKKEKAREWAAQLVSYLVLLSLYPSHTKTGYKKEEERG